MPCGHGQLLPQPIDRAPYANLQVRSNFSALSHMPPPQRSRSGSTAERIELLVPFAGVFNCYRRRSYGRGSALPDL